MGGKHVCVSISFGPRWCTSGYSDVAMSPWSRGYCQRLVHEGGGPKTSTAFNPPKAKEFDIV